MYSDDPLVLELLALLKAHGIKSVVISPGSRHYAITRSLENDDAFTLYSVADERSAAFFALGLIQATGAPAATLCTSGTASINYGSAVVEAFYQKLPLVVLTADRLPELLGQMEDQMFAQTRLFEGFVRSTALLKPVASDLDKWYVNRVLNEAFTALRAAGGGPVHVNIPILDHARGTFATRRLPQTRVISTHTPGDASLGWDQIAQRLLGRKVMVVWGQHAPLEASTYEAFNEFASTYGVVTLADHLSNLHHASRVLSPMTYLMSPSSRAEAMLPDIVITVGTNIAFPDVAKAVLRGSRAQHWR